MKKLFFLCIAVLAFSSAKAQNNAELLKHYKAYYKQMQLQGDLQGSINALTHLLVLQPNQAQKDTLAYYYLNANQNIQALNVLGIDKDENASELAVEIKAVALKAINQIPKAIEQYEILFKKTPNIMIAYELADLKNQSGNFEGAKTNIEYGLANSKINNKIAFYETNQPYEVPAKAAFLYQKALSTYSTNQTDYDTPIALLDEAIILAPKFSLAITIKEALQTKKAGGNPAGGK
jgi:tetratricopeptide (TPR) repeat protein